MMGMHQQANQQYVSTRRICFVLGISRSTLWRLSKRTDFPKKIAIGNRLVRYDLSEVTTWARTQRT